MQEKKPSNRIEKVNSLVQQVLGEVLRDVLSEEKGITTITKVDVSRDMKWAKVWISIVAGSEKSVLKTLQSNMYDIQGELNRKMNVKIVPRIQFAVDTTGEHAAHISQLIEQIHTEPTL